MTRDHAFVGPRLSRRIAIRVTAVGLTGAAVHLALPGPLLAARASHSPVAATPAGEDGVAGTPVADQLAWFIEMVNGGGTALTQADIEARMAPSILAATPPEQVIAIVQGLAAGYGTLTYEGLTRPPTAHQAVALVTAEVGLPLAVPIAVEDAAPFRITGLNVYPVPTATGDPLVPMPDDGMDAPALAGRVEVDGRRSLYRSDTGPDGPTVVLESGLGDPAAPWTGLLPGIAGFARVVGYDRPNTEASASDPVPTPRTGADVVADLHALLEHADIPGPYVLVGHSIGGIFVRLYASRYPDDVAGLVLVDASHEDQVSRMAELVPPELLALATPDDNAEGIDLAASFAEVKEARTATPIRPMPLVVLSAGQLDPATWPEGWPLEEQAQLHADLQADLASLVPGGRLVVAEQSGHYIHQTQPELVLDGIRQVVEAVRDPATGGTTSATPAT